MEYNGVLKNLIYEEASEMEEDARLMLERAIKQWRRGLKRMRNEALTTEDYMEEIKVIIDETRIEVETI